MNTARFEEQARETRSDFGFDPFVVNVLHFAAEPGDFIEPGEFKAFERAF
jgi:hypothetical protein